MISQTLGRLRQALEGHEPQTVTLEGFQLAGVLAPLVVREERLWLLLTERRADLPSHPGQVAFPGGKLDTCDADLAACAIREASEELGLEPAAIDVLGRLDDVPTPTGFVITPVVALLRAEPHIRPNPAEVASYFWVPLDKLREPGVLENQGVREFLGVRYQMIAYRWDGHLIWGATARMVNQILDLIWPPDSESPGRAP